MSQNTQLQLFQFAAPEVQNTELAKSLKQSAKYAQNEDGTAGELLSLAVSLLPPTGKKRNSIAKVTGLEGDKLDEYIATRKAELKSIMAREFSGQMSSDKVEPISIKVASTKAGRKFTFTIVDVSSAKAKQEEMIAKALKALGMSREEYDMIQSMRPEQSEIDVQAESTPSEPTPE